jgi:CheY-like chemotaxis protein
VRLPVVRRESGVHRLGPDSSPPLSGEHAPLRVLVVDDNADAAELLAELLAAMGHETRVAFDGAAALDAAITFAPDVALLDIGLPAMDGYTLAGRLRELTDLRETKLIAITGYGQSSDRDRSRRAGFHEHLVKPVDAHELERVLDRLRT